MELHLLIAESRHIYRKGLRDIFARDPLIASIEEAATAEELQDKLSKTWVDAVIVNQSLIEDILIFLEIRVIVIATQPDRHVLFALSEHSLSGYLLDKPDIDEDFLRKALHLKKGYCLLDPALTLWALHSEMNGGENGQTVHLTTCEQEILTLREQGFTTQEIAQRRSITQTTVKKHLQNAARKMRKR